MSCAGNLGTKEPSHEVDFVSLDIKVNKPTQRYSVYRKLVNKLKRSLKCRMLNIIRYTGLIITRFGIFEFAKEQGAIATLFASPIYFKNRGILMSLIKSRPDLNPDLVLAHDYFTADISLYIGQTLGIPVTLDVHEYALGQYPNDQHWLRWYKQVVKGAQNYYYPKMNAITTVCDGIAGLLEKEHALKVKPQVILSVPSYKKMEYNDTEDKITILYHGEIYESRALHIAIKSMSMWRKEFKLLLRGYSDKNYVQKLQKIAERYEVVDRLQIEDPVEFNEIIPKANEADIGYFVHLDTSPQRKFSLSKQDI